MIARKLKNIWKENIRKGKRKRGIYADVKNLYGAINIISLNNGGVVLGQENL